MDSCNIEPIVYREIKMEIVYHLIQNNNFSQIGFFIFLFNLFDNYNFSVIYVIN